MKDLYLKPTAAGPDLDILSTGLPALSGGLDNYVYLLLTQGDYVGNELAEEGGEFSSKLPDIMAEKPLTNRARLDIISEADRLLKPLVTLGIAESVVITGEIPSLGTLYLAVRIYEPTSDDAVQFVYNLNWETQKITIQEGLW